MTVASQTEFQSYFFFFFSLKSDSTSVPLATRSLRQLGGGAGAAHLAADAC